jgi:hypothetical protein
MRCCQPHSRSGLRAACIYDAGTRASLCYWVDAYWSTIAACSGTQLVYQIVRGNGGNRDVFSTARLATADSYSNSSSTTQYSVVQFTADANGTSRRKQRTAPRHRHQRSPQWSEKLGLARLETSDSTTRPGQHEAH